MYRGHGELRDSEEENFDMNTAAGKQDIERSDDAAKEKSHSRKESQPLRGVEKEEQHPKKTQDKAGFSTTSVLLMGICGVMVGYLLGRRRRVS